MATKSGAWPQVAVYHLLLAGIALLGWVAVALLAYFRQVPQEWPDRRAPIEDLFLLVFLLCGPAFLAAGIGLARRRRWGRLLTMGLGGLAVLLAVVAIALASVGTLRVGRAHDLFLLGLLPAYSVAVFVSLRKKSHESAASQ
jgi:hypothetical protein